MRPVDGAAVRCGGHCRPDLPACAHGPARVGPTGPGQRCGGRGNTNVWTVRDPHDGGDALAARTPRRVAPPAGARPLVASAGSPHSQEQASAADEKGGHDRTVSPEKCPVLTGVSGPKGGHDRTVSPEKCPVLTGVSGAKGGQDQTLFELAPLETPAETPAKTPAANARAGKEPQNPRTKKHPPSPPEGGSPPDAIFVEETYVTAHGRKRRRSVRVDLDEVRRHLGIPGLVDRDDWEQVRNHLRELVGDSTFEIWLQPLELIAVDPVGTLVIAAPAATRGWVEQRFSRVLARCAEQQSRALRLANEPERQAFGREERGRPHLSAQFTSTRGRSRDGHSGGKPEGWCRETTTAANVGALFAQRGRRVLVVDTDPEFALTRELGLEARSLGVNLVDVIAGRAAPRTRSSAGSTASTSSLPPASWLA